MLPRRYIEEWKEFAPWPEDGQVEQDLLIVPPPEIVLHKKMQK